MALQVLEPPTSPLPPKVFNIQIFQSITSKPIPTTMGRINVYFITFHKSSKVNFTNKILNQFHPSPNTSKMDFRELALKYIYYVL